MHAFMLDGLAIAVIPLLAALLFIDYGHGMAVVECDFFQAGSTQECCGGLVMGLCSWRSMAHM